MTDELRDFLVNYKYEFHTRVRGSSGNCWCIGSKITEWDYGERQARTFFGIARFPSGLREIRYRFSITRSALACGWVQELIGDPENFLIQGGLKRFSQILMADDSIEESQETELHSGSEKEEYMLNSEDIDNEITRVRYEVLNVLNQNAYKGIKRTSKENLVGMICTSDVMLDRTLYALGENGFVKGALSDEMKITPAGENELQKLKNAIPKQQKTKQVEKQILNKEYDVFISHASEDKDSFVRGLAQALVDKGLSVWYDEFSLKLGSSLRAEIDKGLANSTYGLVVLSHNFFNKDWPKLELEGLFALMKPVEGKLLPIWHEITSEELQKYSPMISGILAARSSEGLDVVVSKIIEVVKG